MITNDTYTAIVFENERDEREERPITVEYVNLNSIVNALHAIIDEDGDVQSGHMVEILIKILCQ
jgi:uncharacterized OB-fold protein